MSNVLQVLGNFRPFVSNIHYPNYRLMAMSGDRIGYASEARIKRLVERIRTVTGTVGWNLDALIVTRTIDDGRFQSYRYSVCMGVCACACVRACVLP